MKKEGFTIIEIVIVFLLILGVVFLILPSSLNNTKHAKLVSKWTQTYSSMEYMFAAIKAQQDTGLSSKINKAKDNKIRNKILLETIKPYLRITTKAPANYIQSYMNGQPIIFNNPHYFSEVYNTISGEIIGLKWLNKDCTGNNICAMLSIDINGTNAPNKWGYDIFGINIKQNSIEPLGKGLNQDILRTDCSRKGTGLYCSSYYLIGGRFE